VDYNLWLFKVLCDLSFVDSTAEASVKNLLFKQWSIPMMDLVWGHHTVHPSAPPLRGIAVLRVYVLQELLCMFRKF